MTRTEISLAPHVRDAAGKWSGLSHVFDKAVKDALSKYALFDKERNASDTLAKLFRSSNFGYGGDKAPQKRLTQDTYRSWSAPAAPGSGMNDNFGKGII